jgi:hypothetical protein
MSQQCMPRPTVGDVRHGNTVVRRAKQFSNLAWNIKASVIYRLRDIMHADASNQNASKSGTQAGYVIAATDERMLQNELSRWSPLVWKSYRLRSVTSSTLAAETQAQMDGLGHLEWVSCLLLEGSNSEFCLRRRAEFLPLLTPFAVTDCKSLYDHIVGCGSAGSCADKRVAVDLVITKKRFVVLGCASGGYHRPCSWLTF